MMRAINLSPEIPAQGAADNYVRRKVLLPGHASCTDSCGQSVGQNFGECAGIFVGHHAGDRPGDGSVLGGERTATLKEGAVPIHLIRAGALSNSLKKICDSRAVDGGLATQKPGFRHLIITENVTEHERATPSTDQGVRTIVGKRLAGLHFTEWNLF